VGSVQQAVLEFDEAVQAPWRPALRVVPDAGPADRRPAGRPGAYRDRVGRSGMPVSVSVPVEAAARPARAATPRVPVRPAPRPPVRGGCAAPRRRPGAGRVRLTRRARRLAVVLALALGVALGSSLGPLLAGSDSGDLRLTGASTVVVEPGDTLWSVATSVAGDRDVRAVVDEIQQLNRLDGTELHAGQVLQLP
jgi:nucleoid-associated protein YgaU